MHGRAPEWEWKGGQAGGRHTNEVSTPETVWFTCVTVVSMYE